MAAVRGQVDGATADSARAAAVRRAAAHLFGAAGYAGTTMTDIAAAVGVLPGSLYHHFTSKEQIAVELLSAFDRDVEAVGGPGPAAPADRPADPARRLAGEVMALSFAHAAALRLRAFEPPSVATGVLRAAMQVRPSALERAWHEAVRGLEPRRADPGLDPALLEFALRTVTLDASASYPTDADPHQLAAHLCDALLGGLVVDCPPDAHLDGSAAHRAARDAVDRWPPTDARAARGDRDLIVAAAREEFTRRGYDATTMRDVATAAGVRMGTLYRRVESKEALLREIVGRYSDHLGTAFDAVLAAGSSEVEAIDALAVVFVRARQWFDAESSIVRYGWAGREKAESPFHAYFLQTQERRHRLEDLLRRGTAAGAFRRIGDTGEMALHLRSVLWLPFHEHAGTGVARAHAFLRATLLRGALTA